MSQSAHGAHAPTKFFPNPDQSAVRHLRLTVRQFARVSRSAVQMFVNCGGVSFPIQIEGEEVRDFEPGELLIAEYPKENNPLNTPFSAIYPASMKPEPQKEKPMIDITPAVTGDTLIPVNQGQIGGATVQTVNARELHAYLEVGKDFSTWIKDRIEQYGFVENQDFVVFTEIGENSKGGRPSKEYAITIDMAKELSMVERNQKGKEARQYFIECERRAKASVDPMKALNDPAAMRGLLLTYTEKVLALESKVQEQAPKVDAFERIADAAGSITLRETATTLEYPERKLILWMLQHNWLYRRAGRGALLGYAERIKSGHLTHKVVAIRNERTGEDETRESVRVTPAGLALLAQKLATDGLNLAHATTQPAQLLTA